VVGDFNTPVSQINRSSRQKVNKEIDIYRIFNPARAQYIFFSAAHQTFYKVDLILDHEVSPNKYKK
jgi:hypothetical protein